MASLHIPSAAAATQRWLIRLTDSFPLTPKHTACDLKMLSQLHAVSCKGFDATRTDIQRNPHQFSAVMHIQHPRGSSEGHASPSLLR